MSSSSPLSIFSTAASALFVGWAMFLGNTPGADGHAFLMRPISRILFYTPAFQDGPGRMCIPIEPAWTREDFKEMLEAPDAWKCTSACGFSDMEYCPHCYQAGGPGKVRARAEAKTDPTELALYGGGKWPHLSAYERGELASNGNYYETDAISVRHGICGDPGQTSAETSNKYGQENDVYPVIDTYTEGSVIEMKVVFSTYHWGHLEFFICNADDLPDGPDGSVTQSCFNMHPLDRAADDGDASPLDPNYKGRYYVDPPCTASERDQSMVPGAYPGDVVTARYQLPEGLTCERCIVQMVYYTGNSCIHPGYEEFNPPSWPSKCAPTKADWITLDPGMCGDGDRYPEEFWNCADIAITSDGPRSRPSPSPEPEPEPAVIPTPSPVAVAPSPAPVAEDDFSPAPIATHRDRSTMSIYTSAPYQSSSDVPTNDDGCSEMWMQCGGSMWDGSTCCPGGSKCVTRSDYYSQCVPDMP